MLRRRFLQLFWPYWREQYRSRIAWFAVGILFLGVWDLITLKFAWLPLPYFPGPEKVAASFVEEWQVLVKCTYFSLRLLLAGYLIGAIVGLVMGVLIGVVSLRSLLGYADPEIHRPDSRDGVGADCHDGGPFNFLGWSVF